MEQQYKVEGIVVDYSAAVEVDGELVFPVKLKDCPKGTYIKRKPTSKKVHQRDEYNREFKKYELIDCDDVWGNGLLLKGTTVVYIGFSY